MKLRKSSKKGFTLIELIVVIAILGILAAILVPTITGFIQTARDNTDIANAKMLYTSGVLAVSNASSTTSAASLFATYVTNLPVPQGRTGSFVVYNVNNVVHVYLANTTSSGTEYNPSTSAWAAAATFPPSGGTLIGGTLTGVSTPTPTP